MTDSNSFDELAKKICEAIPEGVKEIHKDIEHNIYALLQSALAKCNFVSREDFDIQTKVLAKTRKKVEALEKQVSALEKVLLSQEKKHERQGDL